MPDFNSLSPAAQEFVNDKKINGEKTIDEWLEFFNPLAKFDKQSDAQRARGNYVKAVFAYIIVFGIFMGLLYMFTHAEAKNFIAPAIVILVSSLLLYAADRYFDKFEAQDIPNLLRGFLVPFLELIERKKGGQSVLSLDLNLSSIDALADAEVTEAHTENYQYLSATIKSSESSSFQVSLKAMGVEQPFMEKYKLHHTVNLKGSFDSNVFSAKESESVEITDSGTSITIEDSYSEKSEFHIEADIGPNIGELTERLNLINGSVSSKG